MPNPTPLDERAERLAQLLSDRGISAPREALRQELQRRRDAVATQMGMQPSSATRYLTDETLAEIADAMVDAMSDEAPGQDPWSREPTIPVPIPFAGGVSLGLLIAARAAIKVGDMHWAEQFIGASYGYSQFIAQTGWPDEADRISGVLHLPKEALAFGSRMLNGAADGLVAGALQLPDGDPSDPAQVTERMRRDAGLLREYIDTLG